MDQMKRTSRFDIVALMLAVVVEGLLLVAAAFGGPHGGLGAWPWLIQFPGIMLVLFVPGESHFMLRVTVGSLVQLMLWYLLIAYALSRLRARRARG